MWGRFFLPVLALFYIASQVTVDDFTIIMAAFAAVTFALTVPSGVIAGLVRRRAFCLSHAHVL